MLRWVRSWIQTDGAIHGFHNHSVWGSNPYRLGDYTSGHSTWASFLIPAIARGCAANPDERARRLLRTLVGFQARSFQDDGSGNFRHVGFQMGESVQRGLIHNVAADAALTEAVIYAPDVLGIEGVTQVRDAIKRNTPLHALFDASGTANQEYARIWAKLLASIAFKDQYPNWYDVIPSELDTLAEAFHVADVPNEQCSGCLRHVNNPDLLEPAEYYGLMILPLVLAYEIYGEQRFLDRAVAMSRHVVRSAWIDEQGAIRAHRLWYDIDGNWVRYTQPMMIAGMGLTLDGISAVNRHNWVDEFACFLDEMDRTYALYQHPAGFVVSATGWDSEADVAPSTAWHTHDLRYFIGRHGVDSAFWDTAFGSYDRTAIVLGRQCFWAERGQHWAISDYQSCSVYKLLGRKDRNTFGRDMAWIGGPRSLPPEFTFPDLPSFIKDNNDIRLISGDRQAIDMTTVPRYLNLC